MENTVKRVCLYSPSQIGDILRIARERACQEEHRTKRYVAEMLGITVARLTNIESGYSQPPFELATDWCLLVKDHTALSKIKHIYNMGLPATDPRLLNSVPDQLNNLIQQATGAIAAANSLLTLSKNIRPGDQVGARFGDDIIKMAEEVLDLQQATESTLSSMRQNWNLNMEQVVRNWTQEALADRVIIQSVTHFETIRKEEFFAERSRSIGRVEH